MTTLIESIRDAWAAHEPEAREAYALFKSWAPRSGRIPGCDTALRLAYRIANRRTVEEAAAREFVYRWHLTVDAMAAGSKWMADQYAPGTLGL
jgi:hypothetical protein